MAETEQAGQPAPSRPAATPPRRSSSGSGGAGQVTTADLLAAFEELKREVLAELSRLGQIIEGQAGSAPVGDPLTEAATAFVRPRVENGEPPVDIWDDVAEQLREQHGADRPTSRRVATAVLVLEVLRRVYRDALDDQDAGSVNDTAWNALGAVPGWSGLDEADQRRLTNRGSRMGREARGTSGGKTS